MEGKDVLMRARTGSGKTGAFAIPVIQRILNSKEVSKCIMSYTKPEGIVSYSISSIWDRGYTICFAPE
jgi:superfamily II DNA/RNA helicase